MQTYSHRYDTRTPLQKRYGGNLITRNANRPTWTIGTGGGCTALTLGDFTGPHINVETYINDDDLSAPTRWFPDGTLGAGIVAIDRATGDTATIELPHTLQPVPITARNLATVAAALADLAENVSRMTYDQITATYDYR